jgi:N,N'-diacetyllegionaminate synthase
MKTLNLDKCYLIAEIGVNHGGCVDMAKQMIAAAHESGAGAVKFQTFTAKSLVSKGTPKVRYQESTTDKDESHYAMIKSLEFKREDHLPVIDYCKTLGIDFISTPYDVDSAVFLDGLGVEIFKTASADIVDLPLHRFLASTGKNVIISTGMATLGEIEDALAIYREHNNNNVVLLHCVSNYPCAFDSLNLKAMQTLAQAFHLPVGYSDHAQGPYPAVMSVALGAKVIEKHFTLDKDMAGPDHKASSNPAEFRQLTDAVRIAEQSLGSPVKQVQAEEMQMRQVSRKSLFLARDIGAGEVITESDITLKRPGTGLYAKLTPEIVGKKASRALTKDQMLQFGDFS